MRRGPGDGRGFARGDVDLAGLVAAAAEGVPLTVGLRAEEGSVEARGDAHAAGALAERLRVLAFAHGCTVEEGVPGPDPQVWTWVLRPAT